MTPPDHAQYRWWILANVFLVQLVIAGFAWNYVIMLVPEILGDLSLEMADWGLLWAGTSLGVCLSAMISGALADRYGVRRIVAAGLVLIAASLLLRAQMQSLAPMFASMVFFGIALGAITSNVAKTLGIWFPPKQLGLVTGISMAGIGIGFTVVGLGTAPLSEWLGGWRELSKASAWVSLAIAALWLLTVRDVEPSQEGQDPVSPLAGMRRVLGVRNVWIIACCYMLFLGSDLAIMGYIATFLTEVREMESEAAGLFVSLVAWAFLVGSLLIPVLSDRIGRRKPIFMLGIGVVGLSVPFFVLVVGMPLMAAGTLYGFCQGAVSMLFVIPLEIDPPGPRLVGAAMGVAITGGFAGGFIVPVIGMRLVAIDPIVGFAFLSACFLLAVLLFSTLPETGPAGP